MRTGRVLLCLMAAILIVLPNSPFAHPITKVIFHGNERVESSRLVDALRKDEESPFLRQISNKSEMLLAVQRSEQTIQKSYVSSGYFYSRIDSFQIGLTVAPDSAKGFQLTFFISEGRRYRIGRIEIRGAAIFSGSELTGRMSTLAGEILNEAILKADVNSMLKLYQEHGYPLAKINIDAIVPRAGSDPGEGSLDIQLHVEEGPHAKIGKIIIVGNETTDPNVIIRELALTPGAYYNSDVLATARARVERLGFFESVSEPELYLSGDSTVAIVLRVKEASTSSIDGILGYNPPTNGATSGYLSGLVDLNLRNISGTGRNASLHYDRTTVQTQTLEVHYLEPWLLGYPLNFQAGFSQRQQDTIYTETSATGDLALAISPDITLIGNLSLDRIVPNDQTNAPFSVYDSRILSSGVTVKVDTRDNSIASQSGVLGLLGASYGVKKIYGPAQFIDSATPSSIGLSTISLDLNGYHKMFTERIVAAIGIHARSITAGGGALDASDLFRLGGLYSIRGYSEEVLLASRYAYANIEMRFAISHFSYFNIFFDGGYLAKDFTHSSSAEQPQYPMGYGIGAQVESPLGILIVSIGLPAGLPAAQAKFSFGLAKQF
jgi:outer membrane protein insertion porin family